MCAVCVCGGGGGGERGKVVGIISGRPTGGGEVERERVMTILIL